MQNESVPANTWLPIRQWPYQWPSVFSVRVMFRNAEAAGERVAWGRRLPNTRLLVNPALFWKWLEEQQGQPARDVESAA